MSQIELLHKNLLDEYNKTKKDLNTINDIIHQIEKELKKPNAFASLNSAASSVIHRDVFEISTLFALFANDLPLFEAHASKALCFYYAQMGESQNKWLIIGLYLMHLLSSNRISEFHMVIEQVEQSVQRSNPYIKTALSFEQFVTEGSYNKILLNRSTLPHPLYNGFVQILIDSVRQEVAACMESSHKTMSLKDATSMLLFDNQNETFTFGKQYGWAVENGVFVFNSTLPMDFNESSALDSKFIIEMEISYAKHLEMII